jgi:hypothetical protein
VRERNKVVECSNCAIIAFVIRPKSAAELQFTSPLNILSVQNIVVYNVQKMNHPISVAEPSLSDPVRRII